MNPLRMVKSAFHKSRIQYMLRKHEHTFLENNTELKFLLFRKKSSDKLIVVFSGMNGQRAVYNYIDILRHSPENRLYILDDFGEDGLGCYYIGTNGQNQVEAVVQHLIEKVRRQCGCNHLIFCGSSKGGYAALNFGLEYPDSDIIAGGPQYHLGYYLTHRRSGSLLHTIAGDNPSDDYIEELDRKLPDKIANMEGNFRGRLFLHYSTQEHTYPEHIEFLLEDLSASCIPCIKDVKDYPQHDDIVKYFPQFLVDTLSKV